MIHCRICGTIINRNENIICESCADKKENKNQRNCICDKFTTCEECLNAVKDGQDKVHTKQCENCIRKGLRDCMYHGYPDDTIPISCSYKIGNAAVDTVYDVPTAIRQTKQAGG